MKHGKKYVDSVKLIDSLTAYDPADACDLVCKTSKAKFDETIEISVRLGVDPRHADQQVRGAVVLPHGTGRTIRVLVVTKGDKVKEAEAAGADFVGGEEMIHKIQSENWFGFDVMIATPDMMGVIGRIGRILGPKGLMPNPKSGTVTMDVAKAVKEVKQGKIDFKVDKTGIVHASIGKTSFSAEAMRDNAKEFINTLIKLKPATSKGTYIKSIYLSSTMGPGIKVNPLKF